MTKTKRNVDLTSSHDDNEDEDGGPSLVCMGEEQDPSTAARMLSSYNSRGSDEGLPPHTLPLKARPGERIIEYEEYIPDVDVY